MSAIYPAYCKVCEQACNGKKSIFGHRTISWRKTQCVKCGTIKPVPFARWIAGLLFFTFAFGMGFYVFYSSMMVLWPLFQMPFIDPATGDVTIAFLLIPGYYAFAWLTGKVIHE